MNRYQEITAARKLLEIPETATMASIKSSYKRLLTKWHPDKCGEDREKCNEMTRKIVSAYQTILEYCRQYQYSFSEEAVKRHLSPEQWWLEHFGDDPLWGNDMKRK
ncbi:J domain-containing protein [Desulforhabdus amnigena]|jgi:DnaJ-class molecular chaperone|nr:J domain-containing protein [Desulforhabdus amnigena]NLJ29693.1 J domain-containing protein [Deltaproteobacteria bacterium]